MKCVLLLTVVLVVVDGTFSSAKKPFELEKRADGDIVRRDLINLQSQIFTATYIYINDKSVCPIAPCVSALDTEWCSGLCELNGTAFGLMVDAIFNCYKAGMCEKNFITNTLTNVNISIAPGNSYNGVCYLHGDQVTLTQTNVSSQVMTYSPAAAYKIYISLQYVFEGLTLSCQPADVSCPECTNTVQNCNQNSGQGSGQSVGFPCCASSLTNQLICLVQQLVRSLGLTLNLLSCNCNCKVVSFLGKRQPDAISAAFQSPVTITQDEDFVYFVLSQSSGAMNMLGENNVNTKINFTSTIPSQYKDDLTIDVELVFTDYYTFMTLQRNFYEVISDVFANFYYNCITNICVQ